MGLGSPARHLDFVGPECYERAMAIPCRECRAGLEHCHGTVILHPSHATECTEDGCEQPEVLHVYRIDCEAIGCQCAAVDAAELRAGSAVRAG